MGVDTRNSIGEKVKHRISEAARNILRFGALAAPFSMMLYNSLIYFEVLPVQFAADYLFTEAALYLALAWMVIGIVTFSTRQPKNPKIVIFELTVYYALAILQSWWVSGIESPFEAYWVMLLVATYVLLGRKGLITGTIVFLAHLVVTVFLLHEAQFSPAFVDLLVSVGIVATSLVFIAVYSSQHTSYQDLITSHIREENERNQNLTLINNLTDAVISTDGNGIIVTCNAAALNILDTNRSIEGKYISDVLKLETADSKQFDVFDELSKSSSIRKRDDIIMRVSENDEMRIEATFAPVQGSGELSGNPDNYVLILRDITRMKSLEEERDEFISVVSHELRTPVAIAEGALSNAELLAERQDEKQIADTVHQAHDQIIYLAKMVNNLSTLSRAERGVADDLELIDVTELAHKLHNQYSPEAEEAGLVFNLDIVGKPPKVRTSKLYLQELLQNFITNAIKYTEKGSITLQIKQSGQKVEFTVSDTGIGIGKSDLKRIFTRFYRAEDYRTRETNGTGLGLYVAAKLAKKMGSKISAESRINHGSKFSFKITAADTEEL